MARRRARETFSESSAESTEISDSENDYYGRRPPKKRQRKTRQTTKGAKGTKNSQRGDLAQVLDLPMDILYEVSRFEFPQRRLVDNFITGLQAS